MQLLRKDGKFKMMNVRDSIMHVEEDDERRYKIIDVPKKNVVDQNLTYEQALMWIDNHDNTLGVRYRMESMEEKSYEL